MSQENFHKNSKIAVDFDRFSGFFKDYLRLKRFEWISQVFHVFLKFSLIFKDHH